MSLPRPAEVKRPQDALAVMLAARKPEESLVALVICDDAGGALNFIDVRGDAVLELVGIICEAAPTKPHERKLILGEFRDSIEADVTEMQRWFTASDLASTYGVRLVDWFLIGEDEARSMAETTFSEDRW